MKINFLPGMTIAFIVQKQPLGKTLTNKRVAVFFLSNFVYQIGHFLHCKIQLKNKEKYLHKTLKIKQPSIVRSIYLIWKQSSCCCWCCFSLAAILKIVLIMSSWLYYCHTKQQQRQQSFLDQSRFCHALWWSTLAIVFFFQVYDNYPIYSQREREVAW